VVIPFEKMVVLLKIWKRANDIIRLVQKWFKF